MNQDAILRSLKRYPDQTFPQNLVGIAKYGARLGYEGPSNVRLSLKNHLSVLTQPEVVDKDIKGDIELDRNQIFDQLPPTYYISPLGLVPKKKSGVITGWRRIHDLSAPRGRSVNDGIPKHYGTMVYENFQHALRLIAKKGRGTKLVKRDLKSAFRFIPVSPSDQWLLMYRWKGKVYVEKFLPFGLRTAPRIFNLFSEAIHWIMELYGWTVCHYIDDFLTILHPDEDIHKASAEFDNICKSIGFEIEHRKDVEGTTVEFLGLEIDTMAMEARLPQDKHLRAFRAVRDTLGRAYIPFHELENLLGFLSFCCAVLPLGRPFLRNIFNLLDQKTRHLMRIRITKAAKCDLQWWMILFTQ